MKPRLVMIGSIFAILGLFVTGNTYAQTKITRPKAGLPYKITTSGSYFLAANLSVSTKTTTAILVKSNNVTINLNGFVISGIGGNSTGVGIDASAATGVTIANGTITGFGTGIKLNSTSTVEGVQIYNNNGNGIATSGSSCFVANSVITGNSGSGLDFSDATSGYLSNVLNNSSNVINGTNMGNNVCSGTICP
ncbi:MAG TPA: hypothetical protein VMF50_12530 [Candidatus Binataceae bacterium]|nr:hypothetical protein [Candidatus Binataceae bacterium]